MELKESRKRAKEKLKLKMEKMCTARFSIGYKLPEPKRGFFPLFKRSMFSVEEEIEDFSRCLWKRKEKEKNIRRE